MRAARFHEYGDTSRLTIDEVPEPQPGPCEVRIRVTAASVNPLDWKVRSGDLREVLPVDLPAVPGRDAAGVVDAFGEGVQGVSIGERVFGLGGLTGATAELAVLSAWAATPKTWSDEQAAAAGLASVTALNGLKVLGPLEGSTLLIEGAAGGVGSAAVEIAVAEGATVIGTASERNHAFLSLLGAIPTTYGAGLKERLAELAPGGIDLVLDTAASGSLADLVMIAGNPARVATIADYRNAQRLGVHMANAENDPALLERAAELGRRGHYTPYVERAFDLEEIAQAHAYSERGRVRGKIVVVL
ncbi:NADP-dependent oxidoreductase [Streptomyces sp. NPDC048663]|uniref:NADP-dependent oxidoreductase n=1 Tax=Streptomyces sp. NPDC048663 TaxID=3155638 RepID=UPI00343DA262